jgi:WD40 repeat protein
MTVTRIVFSPSDEFVLTVSRDLRLCLWQRKGPVEYVFVWEQEKAHQRVIWDLCWSPQGDQVYTCSRDKKICVWRLNGTELELANTVKRSVPLTAIAHHPSKPVLAVGNDSGAIGLWSVDGPKWVQLAELNVHGQLPVSRLAFKCVPYTESVYLASCGEDRSVRLTRVVLTDAFSQLVAFLLCARAVFGTLPQLVAKNIRKYL